ncbi:MAG: DUF5050 domain-containing protein [Sarcina sp.]
MKKTIIFLTLLLSTSLYSCTKTDLQTNNNESSSKKELEINSKSSDVNSVNNLLTDSNSLTSSLVINIENYYILANKFYNNKLYKIPKDQLTNNYNFKTMTASPLIANSLAPLGDSILFSNGNDGGSLYSFKISDFNNYDVPIKKINNSNSNNFINTAEGVYYINQSDQNKLYRINSEDFSDVAITQDSCSQYSPHGSWIFYENASDKFKLYALNLETKARIQLTDFSIESFAISNNIAYVTNPSDNNHIYKIDLSTFETKKLFDVSATNLITIEDNLLFQNNSNYNELTKIKLSKEVLSLESLNLGSPTEYFLTDDKIFLTYSNKEESYIIKNLKDIK